MRAKEESYSIRAAEESDLDEIARLAVELVTVSRSPHRLDVTDEQIREYRRLNFDHLEEVLSLKEGGLFVANDSGGRHIGHILLLGNQLDSVANLPQAWIYDISVVPEWWGRGVGRELLARGERFAADLGLTYIGLGVTEANARAVKFYLDQDYKIERVQMVKRLTSL